MSGVGVRTRSLRGERLRALAPRLLVFSVLGVLCLVGLRSILAGPPEQIVQVASSRGSAGEPEVETFAEAFARAYLTWDADRPEERTRRLAAFLPEETGADAGLIPAAGTSQTVGWTSIARVRRSGERSIVVVAADVGSEILYLGVPVARGEGGLLRIAGYPALLGPPAVERPSSLEPSGEDPVEDEELETVVTRAIGNYLTRAQSNLLADLTPDAIVSLPSRRMSVEDVGPLTWAGTRRVAVQVGVRDRGGTAWTLRYELDVRRTDRWYVRAIHLKAI